MKNELAGNAFKNFTAPGAVQKMDANHPLSKNLQRQINHPLSRNDHPLSKF